MSVSTDQTDDDRPNVIVVVPHDHGRELGCYDRQAHTPNIDSLAEEGVLFEQHYCTTPHCAPSRASISTGLQPHNHGMMGHPFHEISTGWPTEENATSPDKGWEIHEGIFTLPMHLNLRDYTTYAVGEVHTSKRTLGHQHFVQHPDLAGDEVGGNAEAQNVADVIETIVDDEADSDQPFHIDVMTHNAHADWSRRDGAFKDNPVPGYDGPSADEVDLSPYYPDGIDAVEGYDEAEVRENFAAFYEDMYDLDYTVGRVLEALEETGQRENTIIVYAPDHGMGHRLAPKAKGKNYDLGIEAAMVMHYPGRVEGGDSYDTLTSHVDILPTILDLIDGRPPVDVDGQSLRPLIDSADDRAYEEREAVYFEETYFGGYDPVRGIRTAEHKLLRNFWPNRYADSERTKSTEVEVYDLAEDPMETTNVAEDPAYKSVREELYSTLRARLERDHDPILDGPIPPKQGAFDVRM